jgi:amino acid transporter
MACLITALYLAMIIALYFNVSWTDSKLPNLIDHILQGSLNFAPTVNNTPNSSSSVLIIAAINAKIKGLPGLLNGCLIFAALSSANTALYVASRSLYGLTRDFSSSRHYGLKLASAFGRTSAARDIPAWAVLFSALVFFFIRSYHYLVIVPAASLL